MGRRERRRSMSARRNCRVGPPAVNCQRTGVIAHEPTVAERQCAVDRTAAHAHGERGAVNHEGLLVSDGADALVVCRQRDGDRPRLVDGHVVGRAGKRGSTDQFAAVSHSPLAFVFHVLPPAPETFQAS